MKIRMHTPDISSEFDQLQAIIEAAKIYGKITPQEYSWASNEMWRLYYLSGTSIETAPEPEKVVDMTCRSSSLNFFMEHWDGLD